MSLVLEHPDLLGIGIDESSSIIVYPNQTFEVMGNYQVMIYDASTADNIEKNEKGFFSATGLKLHILNSGEKYDLQNKRVIQ